MNKKYLVSGFKDNEEYFYKDLEATENIKILKDEYSTFTEVVQNNLAEKVSNKVLNQQITEILEKIKNIQAGIPELDLKNLESTIKELISDVYSNHSIDIDTVKKEIKDYHKKYNQNQLFEVKNAPEGTLIDYNCKEIRIMCPAETVWKKQDGKYDFTGTNFNRNEYYIEFFAYAPEEAVSYREILSSDYMESLIHEERETLNSDSNYFSGIDDFSRKYSKVLLPVASYNEKTGNWNYYGKDSSYKDFAGWYYSVEWYNEKGETVKADTIRINLTNEKWFRYIEPTYEYSSWNILENLLKKYELKSLPKGAIVKEREKELRVYCPPNTNWSDYRASTDSPANPDNYSKDNAYYIIDAYAPKEAVYFSKTGDEDYKYLYELNRNGERAEAKYEITDDNKIIPITVTKNSVTLSKDEFGRIASRTWLVMANFSGNDANYFGNNSTSEHFVGNTIRYTWYDADRNIIDVDEIRVNLVAKIDDLVDMRTHSVIEAHRNNN